MASPIVSTSYDFLIDPANSWEVFTLLLLANPSITDGEASVITSNHLALKKSPKALLLNLGCYTTYARSTINSRSRCYRWFEKTS
jgi:hypothetical protein